MNICSKEIIDMMPVDLEIPQFPNSLKVLSYEHDGQGLGKPHWHREIEMIYSYQGSLNLGIRDEVLTLEEGEMYIVDSGTTHFFLTSPGNIRYVLQFDPTQITIPTKKKSVRSDEEIFSQVEPYSRFWPQEPYNQLVEIFLEIMKELRNRDFGYEDLVLAKLLEMKVLLKRAMPRKETVFEAAEAEASQHALVLEKLDQIYQYCEEHLREDIRLKDVADLVGYNEQYFTRFFKKHTGKTFIEHLNQLKVRKARWLLVQKDMSLSEIAFESGFSSLKTFHHVFKKTVGMPPGEYRKSFSGNQK